MIAEMLKKIDSFQPTFHHLFDAYGDWSVFVESDYAFVSLTTDRKNFLKLSIEIEEYPHFKRSTFTGNELKGVYQEVPLVVRRIEPPAVS